MTQPNSQQSNEPELDIDTEAIFEKKAQLLNTLNSEETYLIKSFKDGKIEDAYEGILDFSTPEGKAEFNFLNKLISKNNWLVIPNALFKEYALGSISLENLEQATIQNHEKLNISKPNFDFIQAPKVNNDFISNISDVQADPDVRNLTGNKTPDVKTGVASGEAVTIKPSEILSSFSVDVKSKLNELNYYRARVENTKGKVSIKTLAIASGVWAIGVVFSPLAIIVTPAAIAIGGFAILKGMFNKSPDIKNYDAQIDILKEATANMVLKRTGDDTKENVKNFVKNNRGLAGTLFDDKIEAEFARICNLRNIKINSDIFKKAHLYSNGHIIDYNREALKPKK